MLLSRDWLVISMEWYGVSCQRMAWRVGMSLAAAVDQSFGRSCEGEMLGSRLIWAVMMGRRVFRTRVSISWMPRRYPVVWSGVPWMAIWSS